MNTMNTKNRMVKNHAALLGKIAAGGRYEKRQAPELSDLAEAINKISLAVEQRNGTVDELSRQFELLQTRAARPGQTPDSGAGGFHANANTRASKMPTPDERRATDQYLRTGRIPEQSLEARARNVNVTNSGQGLEANIAWLDAAVHMTARDHVPLLKAIGFMTVGNFPARHIVGGGNAGFQWVGDLSDRADTDAPTPGVVEIPAGEWAALPAISSWGIADLQFDVTGWLMDELVDAYSTSLQAAVISGNGVNKPTGLLAVTPTTGLDGARPTGALRYFPSGAAATLPTTAAGIITLLNTILFSLRFKYRENAGWAMNSATLAQLRGYRDSTDRPLLVDSLVAGTPPLLMGYPVLEVEALPDVAANSVPILFGDFKRGYMLDSDTAGMMMTRDEVTKPGFVKFYVRKRIGGKTLDNNAVRAIKIATT